MKKQLISLVGLLFTSMINTAVWAHGDHIGEKTPSGHKPDAHNSWASNMGYTHGEVAVSKNGDILVSTTHDNAGILVFSADGKFKHAIPNAPKDFHGFLLREEKGIEYIYGARLKGQSIVKMKLTGEWVLEIPMTWIPKEYYSDPNGKWKPALMNLTGIVVDDNGDIFVVDGYGMDYIHKFSATGKYLETFGGRKEPYFFANCHKIHLDKRYKENRLLCTDRYHKRLVHLKMDGSVIGDYAKELRRPSGVAFYNNIAAVAEIAGRVSLLDRSGEIVKVLSVNDAAEEISTNKTKPEKWKRDIVTSPHGIIFDKDGNLYVTEWNLYGRVLKFTKEQVFND